MSSLWRCNNCQFEGDAQLWAHIETQAGKRLGCVKCGGRLKLVPLGAGDAEAQAYLEAFHTAKALAAADDQQKLLLDAQERLSLQFTDSVLHEIYGPDHSPEAVHEQRVQRDGGNPESI